MLLITGANRGIGAGFTRYYLDEGSAVWACYRNSKDELAEAFKAGQEETRKAFAESFHTRLAQTLRHSRPLAVSVIDLDDLKSINVSIKELDESSGEGSPVKQYGGLRRLPYLAIVLSHVVMDRAFEYAIYSNTTISLCFAGWCLLVALVSVHYRLKNIGYNGGALEITDIDLSNAPSFGVILMPPTI